MPRMTFEEFAKKHRTDEARGGYWIKADGSTIPVLQKCDHTWTLERLREEHGDSEPEKNSEAYARGWVRISFCEREEIDVDFSVDVADSAIATLLSILRHFSKRPEAAHYERGIAEIWKDHMNCRTEEKFRVDQPTDAEPGECIRELASKISAWHLHEKSKRRMNKAA